MAGAREIRIIFTNTTASAQSVRAKFISTTAGERATRVNLFGTNAIHRFGNSDAVAASRLGRRADVLSGHLGKVRVRYELGQARSLGGTILGGRSIALNGNVRKVRARHKRGQARRLSSNRNLMRGAIALSVHMRRGKVAGAGQARSLVVTAGRRLGRARKSTTNLLGLEADIRRGHGGEVDQVRSNIRLSAQVQSGHIGRVRVRLEHAQARRLSGTILGRRANALSVNRKNGPTLGPNISHRGSHRGRVRREEGTHQVNIIAIRVSVGNLPSVVNIGRCRQGMLRTKVYFRRPRRMARRAGGVAAML